MAEDYSLSSDRLKELLAGVAPEVLQQVMPLTGGVITMMFTDIVGSTGTKAQLGDRVFFDDVLAPHNTLVRDCLSHHNGRELKTIGDAFLIAFAVPADGVACAVEIQQRLSASPIPAGSSRLRFRIGLHTGTPIVYRDPAANSIDLSGTDVDRAARVEALAGGGQVLMSEETRTLAKPEALFDWGLWELRGLGKHRIIELLWPGRSPQRPSGHPWLEPVRFLTSFVGREAEISQAMDAVLRHRLVTLKGMGGIGKTRLSDEVAARVSQEFPDGVFFIELAGAQNSEAAVATEVIAKLEVNVAGFPDEAAALEQALANRKTLLVLDNFEVVMSAAPVVGRLLRRCAGIHFLVTSQGSLGLDGEQQIEILPMAAPAAGVSVTRESLGQLDSFQLFQDRARLKTAGWNVSPAEALLVAEILGLTDGIPLSIELAAAWVDRISPQTLRDGLRRSRAEVLKRSGPALEQRRHASIQACIDWSFTLLSREEQALFPGLSVFAGGFFAEDVAQICQRGNAAVLLDSLQRRSLLLWEGSLGRTRYRLLPTVQEYAVHRLGARKRAVRRRHTQHFLVVLDRADDQIKGREQMAGIARISADLDNVRAGMEAAIEEREHRMVVRYS